MVTVVQKINQNNILDMVHIGLLQ